MVNEGARNGKAPLDAVLDALSVRWCTRLLTISDPATLCSSIEEALALRSVRCVILAGGDGTVNAALPTLTGACLPFGVIPLGTANDLARTLGLPADPVAAAEIIASGRTRRIDVARVNDRFFVNAAGIGLGSELQEEVTGRVKQVFGRLAYPLTVLRRGWANRPFHASVRGGGLDARYRVIQITIANGTYYGGGMTVREDATIDDGQLDVVLLRARPLWVYLLHGMSLRTGVYARNSPMVTAKARELTVHTRRPKAISTDGERVTQTPATFELLRDALEVFVP